MPYDALKYFASITELIEGQLILAAHPSVPVRTVHQPIDLARARPGKLKYGSSGAGGGNHLAAALFQSMAGIHWVHVPFKGAGPSTIALMGGEIDFVMASTTGLLAPIRAGRLRPIAVTGAHRFAELPDVPTIAEAGVPGYAVPIWYGFYGPAGVPAKIIERLYAESKLALTGTYMASRLAKAGNRPVASRPDLLDRFGPDHPNPLLDLGLNEIPEFIMDAWVYGELGRVSSALGANPLLLEAILFELRFIEREAQPNDIGQREAAIGDIQSGRRHGRRSGSPGSLCITCLAVFRSQKWATDYYHQAILYPRRLYGHM